MLRQKHTSIHLFSIILCWLLLAANSGFAQFYNGTQMNFGKNRVQYREFLWSEYRFERYDTYYYVGGQDVAGFVSRIAEDEILAVEKMFDYKLDGRLSLLVFNKLFH